MNFPKKEKPINEYITPENIGKLKSFDNSNCRFNFVYI
jgi:hypothetical protein